MEIIFNCGDFPNLPLIGTQECINSNRVLSVRQLEYRMEELNEDNTHPVVISCILLCRELLRRFKKELEELQARKSTV